VTAEAGHLPRRRATARRSRSSSLSVRRSPWRVAGARRTSCFRAQRSDDIKRDAPSPPGRRGRAKPGRVSKAAAPLRSGAVVLVVAAHPDGSVEVTHSLPSVLVAPAWYICPRGRPARGCTPSRCGVRCGCPLRGSRARRRPTAAPRGTSPGVVEVGSGRRCPGDLELVPAPARDADELLNDRRSRE
jgi:hypothetical protein